MAIRVECPGCKKWFDAPEEYIGRDSLCPHCRTPLILQAPQPQPPREVIQQPFIFGPQRNSDPVIRIAEDVEWIKCWVGWLLAITVAGLVLAFIGEFISAVNHHP